MPVYMRINSKDTEANARGGGDSTPPVCETLVHADV